MRRRNALLTFPLAVFALAASAGAAEPYRITYIQGVTGNPFYTSVGCGGADAARRLNVQFDAQGPQQFSPAMQMRVLDAVIASKPDGILFTADDPVALTPTLLQAKAMGIKIISIDGNLADLTVAAANIQADNYDGGRQAGERLVELLGGKGEVMAVMNTPAPSVSQQRLQGFKDAIAKHAGITFLGVQYSNNQTAKAASIITATVAALV